MIKRILGATLRIELVLVLAGAALLAPALARKARADGASCVDACVRNVGLVFEANGRFWILADCGTSELGTGTVWCKYTGYLL